MNKFAVPPSLFPLVCCAVLGGCAAPSLPISPAHIAEPAPAAGAIPETVQQSAALRPPEPTAKVETYSVTVYKVPVQSLLFALARDAGMNVDIHPGITGMVTLNAIDQTLPQLLTRISAQVDMRYEVNGKNLVVLPDTPFWRNYKVDYVNISRSTSSSVNIATQISTTGTGGGSRSSSNSSGSSLNVSGTDSNRSVGSNGSANASGSESTSGNNNSTTSVWNRSDNNFWASLEKNIREMLRESARDESSQQQQQQQQLDQQAQQMQQQLQQQNQQPGQPLAPMQQPTQSADSSGNANRQNSSRNAGGTVIVNQEAGLIAVRATSRQHEKVQQFMDLVQSSAKRQVLIEATIVEVKLSDQYQQGINWSRVSGGTLTMSQGQVGSTTLPTGVAPATSAGMFLASYANTASGLSATIQLLESFGKVKVLSSPKISALNNQTALLKVVDNNVFFTIKVTPAILSSTGTVTTPATYESQLETVPVGFVMSVTPQISESGEVTLNVRPTITRIVGYVQDPNPALADSSVVSRVPVIQAREMESILKVSSGQIAVMGGLMQDSVENTKDSIPGIGSLPVIGNLFSYRNEASTKTELVIFMRPVVVKDASVNGDYKDYRYLLPDPNKPDTSPYSGMGTPAGRPVSPARMDGS
jgi:general secretion pathway protein D